jgi:hypothetical protein
LQNLGVGEAIARVERADYDFNLNVEAVPTVDPDVAKDRVNSIREFSRKAFGRPRGEVEEEFMVMRAKVESAERTTKAYEPKRKPVSIKGSIADKSAMEPWGEQQVQTDEGRSGEHKYLQNIVKRIGEKNGFIATVEKEVLGGIGRIDVALYNGAVKIACEIAVTNTVSYETLNIQKCLSAGYDRVVVVSTDTKHLQDIRRGAESLLNSAQSERVHFLEPENFPLFLESLQVEPLIFRQNSPQKIKGYQVDSTFALCHEQETEAIRDRILEIILRASGNEPGG